jgi:hypothetical protein
MSATAMNWPAATATGAAPPGPSASKNRVPTAGSVVILTASRVLAGLSFGSLNPKSAAVKT